MDRPDEPVDPRPAEAFDAQDGGAGDAPRADEASRLVHRWASDERAARRVLARFRAARASEEGRSSRSPLPFDIKSRLAGLLISKGRVAAGVCAAVGLIAIGLFTAGRRAAPRPELAVRGDGAAWTLTTAAGKPSTGLVAAGTLTVSTGEAAATLAPHLAVRARAGAHLTAVELTGDASKRVTLRQDAGTALYDLTPHCGWRLAIETPAATVRVTGTRFRVTVDATSTTVAVGRGAVEVSAPGGPARAVPESHQVIVAPGAPVPEPGAFNMIIDPDFAEGGSTSIGVSR